MKAARKPPPWDVHGEGSHLRRQPSVLNSALDYARRGLSVVPQEAGAKMPCVKWKGHQDVAPSEGLLWYWFRGTSDDDPEEKQLRPALKRRRRPRRPRVAFSPAITN
jgi:hypothetical protein